MVHSLLLLAQMDCKCDHGHDDADDDHYDDHGHDHDYDHNNGYAYYDDDHHHLCLHALISMKKPMMKAQIQRKPASK